MKPLLFQSLILTAFALSAATACIDSYAESKSPLDLKKIHRIVILGDSITEGGAHPGGYVWLIDQYLKVLHPHPTIEVINAGISGNKSDDMLARFQRDVLDKKPDLATISVGINDVWHGFAPEHPAGLGPNRVPLEDFRRNVSDMLEAARKANVKIVMFTTTIFEDEPDSIRNVYVARYNDALRELAKKYGALVADQNEEFTAAWEKNRASGAKLTVDGVHMAPPGDELMARTALLAFGIPAKKLDEAKKHLPSY